MAELTSAEKHRIIAHFPEKISSIIVNYATDVALLSSRYIFTRRYCTHCQKEYLTEKLKHGDETVCKKCGSKCRVKASGRGRKTMVDQGLNTFCDREWGEGRDTPAAFNPTELDARQWAETAKRAGFSYLMLTAKHHDGFCLWQTDTTDYSVKSSPWKNGQGDVVGECAEACRKEGLLFGIYLSPWDRHDPRYPDREAYDDVYCAQLTELLTRYGPLVEIWFDGAGSEGREYDWPGIMALVKKYQPDAMVP